MVGFVFFKAPVRIVAQRQLNGNLYYDMDNAIDFSFYLFSDQFEVWEIAIVVISCRIL